MHLAADERAALDSYGHQRPACPAGCGGKLYVLVLLGTDAARRRFACDTCDHGHESVEGYTEAPLCT